MLAVSVKRMRAIPSISPTSDTTIYMWRRSGAGLGQPSVSSPHGRNAVWSDYGIVLHGTSDTFVPVAHATYTQRIVPGASLDIREGLGHFSIIPTVVPVLAELLKGRASSQRVRA